MGIWQNTLVRLGVAQAGPKITTQDRAILDLKLQRDKLKQYQKRLQVILDREHEIAREALIAGNKKRALTALRQRKYQEQLLSKTDSQLVTLQELVSTIEFTQIQNTVLHGLEMGSHVLGELQKEMSLERVDRLMDQTREGVEYQREIDEALMSKMSPEEEEAVQEELERLQKEALPNVPESSAPVALPNVPVKEPSVPEPVEPNGKSRICLCVARLQQLVLTTSLM
ncbi:charged multivesicular body protein 6 [Cryptococcus neoformans C23]|nr:charged multivesicular body protein 6 [Cryptococcus neoformans var. grubii AD2-60a]OWZ44178.1 charged multivesicular body protein 6 [Cryptococcus neoformans var. grubii C23]OWZ57805.1 charged multivesicular body protein 6 [Cryptococcus neoformans var. grubii 125.91]OXC85012.1 charged multivesicular body protein 6 [Cryptococcus neoformans var. grubii AD1-7a]OXH33602.1 charged multivesicular body protein 6 [Cryptococcus neoformans var. grubii]